ncbi:alpha/beta fold hydrolase [Hyalangium versicolor]|uniref:alpha/beta fold hydrolase n=1 Tax=Hyalangium versicolor TaxID=2861190 RepID=UPI001CCE12E5|nr:alpha/beta hydrolase [Hyalangium versicolor]
MSKAVLHRNNVHVLGQGQDVLVFAHGFGTDQTAWRHQVRAFQDTHRIILFDHVGAGGSDINAYSTHRYSTMESYAADMLEVFDAVNARDIFYVGHSMSCMVGLLAWLSRPTLFRSMVFIGASPCYFNSPGYTGGFERKDLDAVYEAMEQHYEAWVSGFARLVAGPSALPEVAETFAQGLFALRPDIAIAMARLAFETDLRAQVPKLKLPTWVLQPQQDFAVPVAVGHYLVEHLPQGHLKLVPNQGHLPHLSAPGEINAHIAAALKAA